MNNLTHQSQKQDPIPFGSNDDQTHLEVITHPRRLHVYQITESEIDSIQEIGQSFSLDIAILALSFGAFTTVIVTLTTVDIPDAKVFATYVAAAMVSGIGSVFFSIRSYMGNKAAKKKVGLLKDDSIKKS